MTTPKKSRRPRKAPRVKIRLAQKGELAEVYRALDTAYRSVLYCKGLRQKEESTPILLWTVPQLDPLNQAATTVKRLMQASHKALQVLEGGS